MEFENTVKRKLLSMVFFKECLLSKNFYQRHYNFEGPLQRNAVIIFMDVTATKISFNLNMFFLRILKKKTSGDREL